jgi:hypothetical protein
LARGLISRRRSAQGITDAFLDAERVSDALDAVLTERSTFDDGMAAYQTSRDEHVTGRCCRQPTAMGDFVSVQAGTLPIPEFFSPDNIGRIMATQQSSPM